MIHPIRYSSYTLSFGNYTFIPEHGKSKPLSIWRF